MAQVDPTTSVEEAMAVGVGVGDDNDSETMKMNEVEYAYAPESFWVSKDAELDWVDRNAYLERKDSGKATSSGNSNSNSNTSQRYSGNLKSNTSLLALPKPHKQLKICRNTNTNGDGVSGRLFSKPVLSMNEPGSPKVSCMGRVKSRKDSRRKNKPQSQIIQTQTQSQSQPALVRNKSRSGVSIKQRRSGFWSNFRSMFHYKGKGKGKGKEPHTHSKMNDTKEEHKQSSSSFSSESTITNSKNNNKRAFQCDSSKNKSNDVISMEQQPPSLGGMKRFASGRKSDSWAGDVHVHIDAGPIWLRREVDADPPQLLLDVHRDCRAVSVPVGPLSV